MNRILSLAFLCLIFSGGITAQENGYSFTILKETPSTPIKNQSLTSTCWSFSGISFLESELMRMGKKQYDLSEMYIVNQAYKRKAEEYVRRAGSCSFSPGGQFYDFIAISKEAGIVPDEIYPGLNYGLRDHNHDELDAALKGYVSGIVKSTRQTSAWQSGFDGILEAYLGKVDHGFLYHGDWYTPKTFAGELGINFDDYIVVSSFNNHPFYKESVLEVPGNWAPCTYFNLPLEEMLIAIDNALMSGFSVAWASDMRGKGFSMKRGVAIVPEQDWNDIPGDRIDYLFANPHPQKKVTQEMRQREIGNNPITGDHGMHIVGLAKDQEGNIFYKVKNSWGPQGKYKGYIFVSREFVKLKTTTIMINRNSLPVAVAEKLGFGVNKVNDNTIAGSSISESVTKGSSVPEAPLQIPVTH
jgi:bleomycin hydrolase